jgi:hypothetical protein
MKRAGALVLNGGLEPANAATLVRPNDVEVFVTDGPYAETKEHGGRSCIVEASKVDDALAWARKLALATTLPIEVRAFQHGGS